MRKHVVLDREGNVIEIEDMPDDVDPVEYLRQVMHDCPECRAAMDRGAQEDLAAIVAQRQRRAGVSRRSRWRTRKRRR